MLCKVLIAPMDSLTSVGITKNEKIARPLLPTGRRRCVGYNLYVPCHPGPLKGMEPVGEVCRYRLGGDFDPACRGVIGAVAWPSLS